MYKENNTNIEGTMRGKSIGHSFYVIQHIRFSLLANNLLLLACSCNWFETEK